MTIGQYARSSSLITLCSVSLFVGIDLVFPAFFITFDVTIVVEGWKQQNCFYISLLRAVLNRLQSLKDPTRLGKG